MLEKQLEELQAKMFGDHKARPEPEPQEPSEPPQQFSLDAVMIWIDEMAKSAMGGLLANDLFMERLREARAKGGRPSEQATAMVAYRLAREMWEQRASARVEIAASLPGVEQGLDA